MKLSQALQENNHLILNGPIKTRLEFEYAIKKSDWELIRAGDTVALRAIFTQDIAACQKYNLPIVINANTFRASKNHLKDQDMELVNRAGIEFMKGIKREFDTPASPVLLAAPIGSMYDAYCVDVIPAIDEAREYHQQQVNLFETYDDIDYVNVITLPSLNEGMGIAQALQMSTKDYTVGFILNKDGKLLDGHSLDEAIAAIDESVSRKPVGYMIYCTHPSVLDSLNPNPRIIGLKANASSLPLHLLDSATKPEADAPELFGESFQHLKDRFDLRILGGCCGATMGHLNAIIDTCRIPAA